MPDRSLPGDEPARRGARLRLLAEGHPGGVLGPRRRRSSSSASPTRAGKLGSRCVVLGHHYQREDIIQFADYRGDSFKLARWAAEQPEAEFIVFCGVHFMAESADILSQPHQKVVLPNMSAGCSMADMADPEDVYACWDELAEAGITDIVPVTYMNSAASLKAFCGRNGGIVCTSSNAPKVYDWAFERGRARPLLPRPAPGPQHRPQAGIRLDEMAVWDYTLPYGSPGRQRPGAA